MKSWLKIRDPQLLEENVAPDSLKASGSDVADGANTDLASGYEQDEHAGSGT
jgi:hypothetical protein